MSTPLITILLKRYKEDPKGRVFAPLAEAYRKAGLVEEAIDIAREGLVFHPGFMGGKVALARALFDQKEYEEVIKLLTPVVEDVPDNIAAQKLLAESSLMLGRVAEALSAYKMLLYFSPQDREVEKIVLELETEVYRNGTLVLNRDTKDAYQPLTPTLEDPVKRKKQLISRIEKLQSMLLKVERYRMRH